MCLEGSLTESPKTAPTFVSPLKHCACPWHSDPIVEQNGWISGLNIESVMHIQMRRTPII